MTTAPLLQATNITKIFKARGVSFTGESETVAVNNVDIEIPKGHTVGVIGESGSGKSTLARVLGHLLPADEGEIRWDGEILSLDSRAAIRGFRTDVQFVFQDPYGSLSPRQTIQQIVTEPLTVHRRLRRSDRSLKGEELLDAVGLTGDFLERHPNQLSGGQRQRVAIARALALEPKLLIADEPTSALDLSTRAEILNLFLRIQQERGLSLLLISHDFATIRHLSHQIYVMKSGEIVESGDAMALYNNPRHPYTQTLLESVLSVSDSKGLFNNY